MLTLERLLEETKQGVLPALKILGDIYLNGFAEWNILPDLEKAIGYYERAAEGGMEDALLSLGYIYCAGEYREPDYEKSISYYEQAADMGNTIALGNLGMMYLQEIGVEKDEKKGFAYFLRAADGGHPTAMSQVAILYRDGIGEAANQEKCAYWAKREEMQRKGEGRRAAVYYGDKRA